MGAFIERIESYRAAGGIQTCRMVAERGRSLRQHLQRPHREVVECDAVGRKPRRVFLRQQRGATNRGDRRRAVPSRRETALGDQILSTTYGGLGFSDINRHSRREAVSRRNGRDDAFAIPAHWYKGGPQGTHCSS